MSHHGREDTEECTVGWHETNLNRYGSAVELIKAIAARGLHDPGRSHDPAPHVLCDRWLEEKGFDCEASRRREREKRAIELDAQIERLRQERAALDSGAR